VGADVSGEREGLPEGFIEGNKLGDLEGADVCGANVGSELEGFVDGANVGSSVVGP